MADINVLCWVSTLFVVPWSQESFCKSTGGTPKTTFNDCLVVKITPIDQLVGKMTSGLWYRLPLLMVGGEEYSRLVVTITHIDYNYWSDDKRH